jgi:hypothetical protein
VKFEITHHALRPDDSLPAEVLRTAPSRDISGQGLSTSGVGPCREPSWMPPTPAAGVSTMSVPPYS